MLHVAGVATCSRVALALTLFLVVPAMTLFSVTRVTMSSMVERARILLTAVVGQTNVPRR